MTELSNPHDKFFKEAFSRPDIAESFLRNYLPKSVTDQLHLSSLSLRKDSFIDQDLQQHFSDLLYEVTLQDGQDAYVYVLFEHKSYPEPLVAFQLLRYLVRIWEQERPQDSKKQLVPIIPLVVYHGRAKWNVDSNFGSLFTGPEALRLYWPEFHYQLCDLSTYDETEIKGAVVLQALLLLLKHIFDEKLSERLPVILGLLQDLAKQETGLELLETILRYVAQATDKVTEADLVQAVNAAFPEVGDVMMATIAEKWVNQGIEQAIRENIKEVLEIRFGYVPEKIIAAVNNINDPATLRELHKQAITVDSLASFQVPE